jgi:ribose transport system substrate-binding protein
MTRMAQVWTPVRALVIVVALSLTATLVACGDDDDGGGGGSDGASSSESNPALEQARDTLATATELPKFTFEGEPFDASKAAGKTIFSIPLSSAVPYVNAIEQEMKDVAALAGAKQVSYENKGSTQEHARGIQQAISSNADVIILQNLGPETLLPQLRAAKRAGIPVVVSHWYANGTEPPAAAKPLVTALSNAPFAEAGRLSTSYAVLNTDEDLHPLIITEDSFPISGVIKKAMRDELEKLCESCEATEINVPLADWQTKMQAAVQSALTRDPKINYVLPLYDSMSLGVQAAIRASGKSDEVKIASFNGTADILKLIVDDDIMQADVGEDPKWIAWATMDQALRLASGVEPIADGNEQTPLRVFDDSNIADAGSPPKNGQGYGDAYVDGYKQIWGLSGQ